MNQPSKNRIFIKLVPITIIVIFIGLMASCKGPLKNNEEEYEVQIKAKTWAFLLYDDAEFQGYDPLDKFAQSVCSGENLNILVLQDTIGNNPKIWYIDENHQKVQLKIMKEVNMGDYQTLRDFLEYAKSKCSAQRYLLAFYDHGYGWEGACIDVTSDYDILSMEEMQAALIETGGVDMVCFTAPCLMGAIESVYELRNCTEVYIGSEEYSGYIWWEYPMGRICQTINQNPQITNMELAKIIIKYIYNFSSYWSFSNEDLTMSAIRTDKIGEVINALDALTIDLTDNINESYPLVSSVYNNVLSFDIGELLDVYDLFEKCHSSTSDAALRSKLERVLQALSDAVIAECHGDNMENAHGLSIFFPKAWIYDYYKTRYTQLDIAKDTHWNEFLNAYLSVSGQAETQHKEKISRPYPIDSDGFYPRRSKFRGNHGELP